MPASRSGRAMWGNDDVEPRDKQKLSSALDGYDGGGMEAAAAIGKATSMGGAVLCGGCRYERVCACDVCT